MSQVGDASHDHGKRLVRLLLPLLRGPILRAAIPRGLAVFGEFCRCFRVSIYRNIPARIFAGVMAWLRDHQAALGARRRRAIGADPLPPRRYNSDMPGDRRLAAEGARES